MTEFWEDFWSLFVFGGLLCMFFFFTVDYGWHKVRFTRCKESSLRLTRIFCKGQKAASPWRMGSLYLCPIWLLSKPTLLCKTNLASRQSSCSLACRKCFLKHSMCFLLLDQEQINSVDIAMSRRLLQSEPFPSLWRGGSLHWTDVPECCRPKSGCFKEKTQWGRECLSF